MNEDGITFEIGEETYDDVAEEEFAYSPNVQFSNEEMLNMLNMNDFDDEEEDNENGAVSLCGMSFSKLKTKMTNLTTDGKVNQILYYIIFCILFFSYRDNIFDFIDEYIKLNKIMNVTFTDLMKLCY